MNPHLRPLTLLCLFVVMSIVTKSGWANPIAITSHVFISSESVKVNVDDKAARIDGSFHFHFAPNQSEMERTSAVNLEIPIWLPVSGKSGDATVKAFYTAFSQANQKLNDQSRPAFNQAFDFRLTINGKAHPISFISLSEASKRKNRQYYRSAWIRAGYEFVEVKVSIPSEWVAKDPEIRLTYRQPLLQDRKGAEFFYVPTFVNLPSNQSTTDLTRYSMRITAGDAQSLSFGTLQVRPGASAILPLSHDEPIIAKILTDQAH